MTYTEIKKELKELLQEYENAVRYEKRLRNKIIYTGWNEGYETNDVETYYEKIIDEEKRIKIAERVKELRHLPEYLEGKKAEDEKVKIKNEKAKAKRYEKELIELEKRKIYLEKWLAEYKKEG